MSTARIDAAIERSALVRAALETARQAHSGQVRHTGKEEMPFIEHPLAVAERLAGDGCPDEALAAGLLHDVLEKSDMELDELRERFGGTVARLVDALTEKAAIEDYGERKDEHRRRIAGAGPAAQAIFAADKLVNLESLREAYGVRGEDVDGELQVPLDTKVRTWELDLTMLREEAGELPVVGDFSNQLAGLLADRAARRAPSN
ncbi:MAG: HD domain-containing protein [Solirubrobacterales bacterium]